MLRRGKVAAALFVGLGVGVLVSGCGETEAGSSGSAEVQARTYIGEKNHTINLARVDYEHVVALVALAQKSGETGAVINEIAKVAQESHDQIDGFREELFKTGGDKKLSEATFELSEGANELKNSMGALVAYTGNPNPATLAHFTVQLGAAQSKWNQAVDEVWEIAHEHGALRLEASHGLAAAKAAESVQGGQPDIGAPRRECEAEGKHWNTSAEACQ
jgi:hypothetical protein